MKKEINPIVQNKMDGLLASVPEERREEVEKLLHTISAEETDTGAIVALFNLPSPEDSAMLQSLNSRSSGGMFVNLRKVLLKGSSDFMESFYVNYGDKSIGDCGTVTIYLDGISMIAAKQLQNWPLYSGQDTSTRYAALTKLGCYDPIDLENTRMIIDMLMDFYEEGIRVLPEYLKARFPMDPKPSDKTDGEHKAQYEKTINAKMYDILGAFLPAGARTNASIHMNLRQIDEQQRLLIYNPSGEVSGIAENILNVLKSNFPATYTKKKSYPEQEEYWKMCAEDLCYFDPDDTTWPEFQMWGTVHMTDFRKYQKYIDARPKKTELPKVMGKLGDIHFKTLLDYRSFRDIQRQRNGITEIPLLTIKYGFENWYLKQLPENLKDRAISLLREVEKLVFELSTQISKFDLQYFIPMGYKCPCEFSRNLVSEVFVQELRTGLAVHPTVRNMEKKCAEWMMREFPDLKLHVEMSDSEWDMKRGLHDIVEK